MTNHEIAAVFDQIADLLEFQGANPFRVRAYRNAARTIHDLPESAADIVADPERSLTDIEGIGKDLAEKVAALVADRLAADARRAAGRDSRKRAGDPSRARLGSEAGGPTLSRAEDRHARRAPRGLPVASGPGTQRLWGQDGGGHLQGLDIAAEAEQRILWTEADQHVREILAHMNACEGRREDRRRRQLSPRQGDRRRPGFSRRHRATSTP